MHWFGKTICSGVGGLMLLCNFGAHVDAACPGLTEELAGETRVNAFLTENETLEYQMAKKMHLGEIPAEKVNQEGTSLVADFDYPLPREISVKLNNSIEIWEKPNKRYLLPGGTTVKYEVPVSNKQVTIPNGTALTKTGATPPVYSLAEDVTVSISPPVNTQLTLTIIDQQIVERIPGTGGMGTTLTFEPSQAPVGGFLHLTVTKRDFDFTKAEFYVCFKGGQKKSGFIGSAPAEIEKVQMGEAKLRVRIPPIPGIGKLHIFAAPVDLVLVARADGKTAEVFTKEFRVSSRPLAIFCWIAAFVGPWILASMVNKKQDPQRESPGDPIWFVSGKYGDASLSLAQILIWTILVFSASYYVLVASGSLLVLSDDVLTLLGIAGGTSVIAKIAASVKDEKGAAIVKAELDRENKKIEPKWLDLFTSDGQADLYKFQMALFTVLAVVFVTVKIFYTLMFPELPAGLLTLIGISNGVYLAAKGTSKTKLEKLGEKSDEVQKAEEELAKLRKEADNAGKSMQDLETQKNAANAKLLEVEKDLQTAAVDQKATPLKHLEEQVKELKEAVVCYKEAAQKKKAADASVSSAQNRLNQLKADKDKLMQEAKQALGPS